MNNNLIIQKTSSEEGRFGEIIAKCFYDNYQEFGGENKLFFNSNVIDTTKNKNFQKIDCDFIDANSNFLIEVKHDTWIAGKKDKYPNGTGNLTYEFATWVPKSLTNQIKNYIKNFDIIFLSDILNQFPQLTLNHVGCNQKCMAHQIFLVGGEEEFPENKKYKLKNIWAISNFKLKNFINSIPIKTSFSPNNIWLRFTYHKEDNNYNLLIIIPIQLLIFKNIATQIPVAMQNAFLQKYPCFQSYHSSQELEYLIN